jgi:hypothetical protein
MPFNKMASIEIEVMATINETDARLNSHEAVCALRYTQIEARLKRLESIIIKACGVMLFAMSGVVYSSMVHIK